MKYYLPAHILTDILDYAFPHYNQYDHSLLYKSFINELIKSNELMNSNIYNTNVKIDINYYRKNYKSKNTKSDIINQLYIFKNKYNICIYDSLRKHNILMQKKHKINKIIIENKQRLKERIIKTINYKQLYNTYNIGDIIVHYKNKLPTTVKINNQQTIQNKTIKHVGYHFYNCRRYYYHSWANVFQEESEIPYFNVNIPFTIFYKIIRKTNKTLYIEPIPAIYQKITNSDQPNIHSIYSCRTAKFILIPDLNTPSQNKVESLSFRYIALDKYKKELEDNKLPIIGIYDENTNYLFYGKKFCKFLY